MSKFTFDMPHALVTLTDVEGNVEIEVWPKAGQSAYVVVPPPIARAIADQIARMADEAEQARLRAATGDAALDEGPAEGATAEGAETSDPAGDIAAGDVVAPMSNIVDLASRRRVH